MRRRCCGIVRPGGFEERIAQYHCKSRWCLAPDGLVLDVFDVGVYTQVPTFYGLYAMHDCKQVSCITFCLGEKIRFPNLNVRRIILEESGFQHQLVVGSTPWQESPRNSRCEMVRFLVGNNYLSVFHNASASNLCFFLRATATCF